MQHVCAGRLQLVLPQLSDDASPPGVASAMPPAPSRSDASLPASTLPSVAGEPPALASAFALPAFVAPPVRMPPDAVDPDLPPDPTRPPRPPLDDEASPERCVEIGANLREPLRTELITCLKKNLNTFAWAAKDMPGIDINITCHELNIDLTFKPVKQKNRKLGPERASTVNDEVEKLLKVGSITEVRYPDWLANPVVVKKKNRKWRVCVDFTDLNKACPKDSFPLPHIDRLVEATAGNELLSFMDAFSG